MNSDLPALKMFEAEFIRRGWEYTPEHRLQEVISVCGTRPDFHVRTQDCDFLIEIESFKKPTDLDANYDTRPDGTVLVAVDPAESHRRIRSRIASAKRQLKPYRSLGIPLVIGIANWRNIRMSLGNGEMKGLYGTPELPQRGFKPGGAVFRPDRGTYLSAVLVLHEYCTSTEINIERNRYADVSLPLTVFATEISISRQALLPEGD